MRLDVALILDIPELQFTGPDEKLPAVEGCQPTWSLSYDPPYGDFDRFYLTVSTTTTAQPAVLLLSNGRHIFQISVPEDGSSNFQMVGCMPVGRSFAQTVVLGSYRAVAHGGSVVREIEKISCLSYSLGDSATISSESGGGSKGGYGIRRGKTAIRNATVPWKPAFGESSGRLVVSSAGHAGPSWRLLEFGC